MFNVIVTVEMQNRQVDVGVPNLSEDDAMTFALYAIESGVFVHFKNGAGMMLGSSRVVGACWAKMPLPPAVLEDVDFVRPLSPEYTGLGRVPKPDFLASFGTSTATDLRSVIDAAREVVRIDDLAANTPGGFHEMPDELFEAGDRAIEELRSALSSYPIPAQLSRQKED